MGEGGPGGSLEVQDAVFDRPGIDADDAHAAIQQGITGTARGAAEL